MTYSAEGTRDMYDLLPPVADDIKSCEKWSVQHTTCNENSRCNSITDQPSVYARYTHKNDVETEFPFYKPTETITTATPIKKSV
jgi:hypothetical protein